MTGAFAPDWLTVEEAVELSGHNPEVIRELIEDGTLATREEGGVYRIEKASLREFQEAPLPVRQLMTD